LNPIPILGLKKLKLVLLHFSREILTYSWFCFTFVSCFFQLVFKRGCEFPSSNASSFVWKFHAQETWQ
jgi:hypothetical protein